MKKSALLIGLLLGLVSASSGLAGEGGRPTSLTLSNFQFGPENRWSFSHIREVVPTVNIAHDGDRVLALPRSSEYVSDFSVELDGRMQTIDEIASARYFDGLLVLKDGEIVFEKYYGHLTEELPHLMNSVSKSVVSLVAGKLEGEGLIDLSKPVSHYVPALAASGWGRDSLQTVLDMRDGADYTEDYPDFSTTFRLQDCAIGWTDADYCPDDGPRGLYEFLPTIGRDDANFGKFGYKSGSTDVLGWVLEAAAGKPLAQLISEHVWKPMGAEFDANISVDQGGMVLADHGMSSTLRDLGRFGLLMINNGQALGRQVVPAGYVEDIFMQPGDPTWPYESPDYLKPFYRSFWWGNGTEEHDLSGYGIHGQTVRVSPEAGIVIANYSTWPRADGDGTTRFWALNDALMDALVARFR
jgi:hypothetical protein